MIRKRKNNNKKEWFIKYLIATSLYYIITLRTCFDYFNRIDRIKQMIIVKAFKHSIKNTMWTLKDKSYRKEK